MLRHHLTLLREDVGWCSRATDAILLCHAQFAYLMAQRIDDASRSWLKGLKYGPETTKLANDINKASRALSQHVTHMQGNLNAFVSALEKMEVRKKRSTAKRILGWLKYLFSALASIFALGSFVSPFLHSAAPGLGLVAPAASTLWKAAAAFCGAASGMFLPEYTSSYTKLIQFRCRNTHRERIGEHRVCTSIPEGCRPEGSADCTEEPSAV